MRYPIRNPLFLAALALGAAALTACSGGGGGGANRGGGGSLPGAAAGPFAINGINKIPHSMIKESKTSMQGKWAIVDRDASHLNKVGKVACQSYVINPTACAATDHPREQRNADGTTQTQTGTAGAVPFSEVLDLKLLSGGNYDITWSNGKLNAMTGLKIVTRTESGASSHNFIGTSGNQHAWLTVHSVGNQASNDSWYNTMSTAEKTKVTAAITANKLLFTAGWAKDANGNYIRHSSSGSCKDVNAGCLWVQYEFSGIGNGTSYSAPQLSAALASVLSVFPDTTPQNLMKFAKASAKKTGQGINGANGLIQTSGGHGVADFAGMSQIITALKNLPTGGNTNVSINGNSVNLTNRALSLSFVQSRSARYFTDKGEEQQNGFSFRIVPNGDTTVMAFGTFREGDLFASLGVGNYESFFGYKRGHGQVFGAEYAAGHKNLFFHLTDIRSSGGSLISHAEGKSFGLSARRAFRPAERLKVKLSADFDRFLGGAAKIPFGKVKLNEGEWNHRIGMAAEYTPSERTKIGFDAGAASSANRKPEFNAGFRLTRTF